jgi:hypothetical protein
LLLDEALAYLRAVSPSLGTVTVEEIPDDPDEVIVIAGYNAGRSDLGFGTPGIKFEYPGMQVRVRGAAKAKREPLARAERCRQECAKVQAMTLNGDGGPVRHLLWIPEGIFLLDTDSKERRVYVFNVLVQKDPSPILAGSP